jgi:hypothetical protein
VVQVIFPTTSLVIIREVWTTIYIRTINQVNLLKNKKPKNLITVLILTYITRNKRWSRWSRDLGRRHWSFGCWDRGLEARWRTCMFVFVFLCCVVYCIRGGLYNDRSLVRSSPTKCLNQMFSNWGGAPRGVPLVLWGRELIAWGTYLFWMKYGCKVKYIFW